MPTVLRWNGYRFYFYSHEGTEPPQPPHIHVDKAGNSAKFWLDPVALAHNRGYPDRDLNRLHDKVEQNRDTLLKAWYDCFPDNP